MSDALRYLYILCMVGILRDSVIIFLIFFYLISFKQPLYINVLSVIVK